MKLKIYETAPSPKEFELIDEDIQMVAGIVFHKEDAEYIVQACNEYQALKEENEKLKEEINFDNQILENDEIYIKKLQQQRDKLVEMLKDIQKYMIDIDKKKEPLRAFELSQEIEQLLQKIKEQSNV